MKKGLKITLIVLGVLAGIILLDALQARMFKNSPIISWREKLKGDSYVDKGILLNTYYCVKAQDIVTVSWHLKNSKFTCPVYEEHKVTPEDEEHSFFGKIVESHQLYIIVEPNEDEEERKSSDQFHIELGNDNDAIYKVGTNVKITYVGGINESYPAQIETTKIELKSVDSFELIFHQESGNVKRQIIDKNDNTKYDYNVYIYNGTVEIVIDNKKYELERALKENKITMDEIIVKANQDIKEPLMYNDGGSVEYHYENYTIIKVHKINGNRDVYIGGKNLTLNDLNI